MDMASGLPKHRSSPVTESVVAPGAVGTDLGAARSWQSRTRDGSTALRDDKPNILVIVVDQMRTPQWFPSPTALEAVLPNISALRRASTSFEFHYTAANACTPS